MKFFLVQAKPIKLDTRDKNSRRENYNDYRYPSRFQPRVTFHCLNDLTRLIVSWQEKAILVGDF